MLQIHVNTSKASLLIRVKSYINIVKTNKIEEKTSVFCKVFV